MIGEPDAGNPQVRFDEGVQETCDIRGAPAPYSTSAPESERWRAAFRLAIPCRTSVLHALSNSLQHAST